MIGRFTALSLALLAWHGPLAAQRAELMHFDGPAQDVVINVGPASFPSQSGSVAPGSDLSNTLAADFSQIGATALPEAASLPPRIQVPQWMQTGVASARFGSSLAALPSVVTSCGGAPYQPRPDLTRATEMRRAQLYPIIASIACEQQIPVGLFDALIGQESRYEHGALSPKGAIGLAQLMPGTASYLGVSNPWDVVENLRGGARYLRMQIEEFGRYDLALAAYNAGPGRVRQQRKIPRIRETIDYVRIITAVWAATERRGSFSGLTVAHRAPLIPQRTVVLATYTSPSVAKPR